MPSCKLIIKDEVNIKFEGLGLEARRKLANKFKFEVPWARYQPSYRLGRWDGTVAFFGVGGTGYINQLDEIIPILEAMDYDIEVEDHRTHSVVEFEPIDETFWGNLTWPKGHVKEGEPIVLRDYQVDAVNNFLKQPTALQELATGAGKTIITATLCKICEKYGRTLTIVPNKSLVEQTEEDFRNCQLDVGVYYGDRKELNRTHTICTWQSLNILDKKSHYTETLTLAEFLDGVTGIIVDECFDKDTLILTPSGQVPISQLNAGDIIINFCEKTNTYKNDTVIKIHNNLTNTQSENMLELEFDNGATIKVTANHKFLTSKGWVRADQLTNDLEIIDINTYN